MVNLNIYSAVVAYITCSKQDSEMGGFMQCD